MNARIVDNIPYCPFCGESNFNVKDSRLIGDNIQLTAKCNKCDKEFEYCVKITLEKNIRYNISE